jgi:hypothetical protein
VLPFNTAVAVPVCFPHATAGGFAANQACAGTLDDVRVWGRRRSAAEIAGEALGLGAGGDRCVVAGG